MVHYPEHANVSQKGQFLFIEDDKLTIRYKGPGTTNRDVGSIQSNRPLPNNCRIAYFEVDLVCSGDRGRIGIGLTTEGYLLTRQPGWDPESYAYHVDDGALFHESGGGVPYGPMCKTGDVVGCGIDYENHTIFFTKNGKHLGVAFKNVVMQQYYPTVGLHSKNECVRFNFGQKPFVFDIDKLRQEEQEKTQQEIQNVHDPRVSPIHASHMNDLVRDYFEHFGYSETLRTFESSAYMTAPLSSAPYSSLQIRKLCKDLIMKGELTSAIAECERAFPNVLQPNSDVYILLHCQALVELVRNRRVDEALMYAALHLGQCHELLLQPSVEQLVHPRTTKILSDSIGIFAYEDPINSPVQYLLEMQNREHVSDRLNEEILKHTKEEPHPALERLLRQLVVTQQTRRELNHHLGNIFKLEL